MGCLLHKMYHALSLPSDRHSFCEHRNMYQGSIAPKLAGHQGYNLGLHILNTLCLLDSAIGCKIYCSGLYAGNLCPGITHLLLMCGCQPTSWLVAVDGYVYFLLWSAWHLLDFLSASPIDQASQTLAVFQQTDAFQFCEFQSSRTLLVVLSACMWTTTHNTSHITQVELGENLQMIKFKMFVQGWNYFRHWLTPERFCTHTWAVAHHVGIMSRFK